MKNKNALVAALLAALSATAANAADVSLLASDTATASTTSFNSATTSGTATTAWSNSLAPSSGNAYFTEGFMMRTHSGGSTSFAGDSLTVGGASGSAAGLLLLKNTAGAVVTVNSLTINGGAVIGSTNSSNTASRTIGLTATNGITIGSAGATFSSSHNGGTNNHFLDISGSISGSGSISVLGEATSAFGGSTQGGTGTVRFQSDNSAYTGVITVTGTTLSNNQGVLGLQHVNAAKNATVIVNTTGTISNPGLGFRNITSAEIGALGGSGLIALSNTGTDRVALTVGGNNASTTFSGVLANASTAANAGTTGTGSLTKIGSGTMTLTGANTFTYDVTVSGGTLALGASNTLGGANNLVLNGGTLAQGAGFSQSLGTLDLNASSSITLGAGGSLVFADSSLMDWGSATLSITGSFVSGQSIKFGLDNLGLSSGQLSLINIAGFTNLGLDSSGFLTAVSAVPEPSSFAALAGLGALGFVATRRRRA